MMPLEWLDAKHPVYTANEKIWARNERRMQGGDDVLDELRRFDWELGEKHELRKAQAVYENFPARFAEAMVGHLYREAPTPDGGLDLGSLGQVLRTGTTPTEAELVYYNADGIGNDASQWDNFWAAAVKMSIATGHRWIFVEAPEEAPASQADLLAGRRPYLVEHSPLSVPMWHYRAGQLEFAIVRVLQDSPRVVEGRLEGASGKDQGYLLLVRQGVDRLGAEFQRGGWWLYDSERREQASGDWSKTGGEIPLFPLFYERARGTKERRAISRPGATELGQAAVALMNLSSAADFDAWDAAASVIYLLGVDQEAFNLASAKLAAGSKMIPVPVGEGGETPQLQDGSTGSVAADVFRGRIESIVQAAERIAMLQATSVPQSSGASKRAGFADVKSPRLALMASELENAQNTAIHFLERRFGHGSPRGQATWPREYDILPLIDEIREIFELEELAGIRSPTLGAKAMVAAAREKGILDDEDIKRVESEYEEAAREARANAAQDRATRDAVTAALLAGGEAA